MDCLILKSFEFSRDGRTTTLAEEGDTIDLPDAMVPGLFKEGFVGEPKKVAAPAPPPHRAAKMMPPLENKDSGSPPNTTDADKAPKSK